MFKKFIVSICIALTLTGCSHAEVRKYNESDPASDFIYLEDNTRDDFTYMIHKSTGVVYLRYGCTSSLGITVLFNSDGTPMTADQLGINIEN